METHVSQTEKRSWIEVDLKQLVLNLDTYKKQLPKDREIMAVIKADAYGHGDVRVAHALEQHGVRLFAVSNIDEAVGLRDSGVAGEILILGYTSPKLAHVLVEKNIMQAIVSEEYAAALSAENGKIRCQFAIDTGMNRIGLDGDNAAQCEKIIRKYKDLLCVEGIFTHLCVADTDEETCKTFTLQQIDKFCAVQEKIRDLKLPFAHCFNSAGGFFYLKDKPEWEDIGKIVRLGIIMYGLKPDESNLLPKEIQPALSWKSVISLVKTVKRGETVGYGRTFKADKDYKVATVATGYADGYSRLLSNIGHVLIHGKKAKILGRICMDQMMVDVSEIPEVKMGDAAVLIGKSGNLSYTADDMAKQIGTIGYEIVCGISKRVQRYYI